MGGSLIKTDLGHGRGWASPKAAASIRRIDAQLGRLADINEAGRSPEQANANRRKWLAYERYLNGGPWAPKAPYALGAEDSVHCWGGAADSDDWYNARAAAVWRDNGWRQTARYPGNKAKDEPWHGEYFEHLDDHRNDPAPAGSSKPTPAPVPANLMEAIRMAQIRYVHRVEEGYDTEWMIVGLEIPGGFKTTVDRTRAEGWGAVYGTDKGGSWKPLTRAQYIALQASARELHEEWLAMQKLIRG